MPSGHPKSTWQVLLEVSLYPSGQLVQVVIDPLHPLQTEEHFVQIPGSTEVSVKPSGQISKHENSWSIFPSQLVQLTTDPRQVRQSDSHGMQAPFEVGVVVNLSGHSARQAWPLRKEPSGHSVQVVVDPAHLAHKLLHSLQTPFSSTVDPTGHEGRQEALYSFCPVEQEIQ